MLISQSLNKALKELIERDENIICLGEDIADPYGGAFKVTKDLSMLFPEKIINTPVSEAGIIGVGIGLSMMGFKPIIEIMFGDFLLLGTDQIINHLSKFYLMHNNLKPTSIVIRTPMGGGRGYGPTHSQSLEKHFLGVPGINVVALNIFSDAGLLLQEAVGLKQPVLFIENKLLYGQKNNYNTTSDGSFIWKSDQVFPTYIYRRIKKRTPDFTIATYGGMSKVCYEVVNRLYDNEDIIGELVIPTYVSDCDVEPFESSIRNTRFFFTLEESVVRMGFGSELIAKLNNYSSFKSFRMGALDHTVIPSTRNLENKVLPTIDTVYENIVEFLERNL